MKGSYSLFSKKTKDLLTHARYCIFKIEFKKNLGGKWLIFFSKWSIVFLNEYTFLKYCMKYF